MLIVEQIKDVLVDIVMLLLPLILILDLEHAKLISNVIMDRDVLMGTVLFKPSLQLLLGLVLVNLILTVSTIKDA
jgi:hypothetical protein